MMDWWATALFWGSILFWIAFFALVLWRALYDRQARRNTIVCPTCGGAGRLRLIVAPLPARGEDGEEGE